MEDRKIRTFEDLKIYKMASGVAQKYRYISIMSFR